MEKTFDKNKLITIFYFFVPFLLFIFQYLFTINSTNQIRYEELAESVRNVFWFKNRLIYDGVSSNVGWYAILYGVYSFLGFFLFTAKFLRLFLYLLSIISLSVILKKYLGYKKAFLPLIAIGLSPTLLYLDTLQAQFGIDLQLLPIIILLIVSINKKHKLKAFLLLFSACILASLSLMSYPTFIYYLPPLAVFSFVINKKQIKNNISLLKNLSLCIFSFLLPLVIIFIYLKNKSLLIFDPVTKGGIFRGSGKLYFNLDYIYKNLISITADLFNKGESYYFELTSSEFSGFYPIISVLVVLIISFLLLRKRGKKILILSAFFVIILSLVVSSLTFDPSNSPGIRRNTGVIAGFYLLFCTSWAYVLSNNWKKRFLKYLLIFIFILIPLHHLIIYPTNLNGIANKSPYQYSLWFSVAEDPQESLNLFTKKAQQESLKLSCADALGKPTYCRYNEIYSAVSAECYFNHLNCKQILGYDLKTKEFIPISVKLWREYYWEH